MILFKDKEDAKACKKQMKEFWKRELSYFCVPKSIMKKINDKCKWCKQKPQGCFCGD